MFAIVPVTNTALGTLAPDRVKNASGLFDLMRNSAAPSASPPSIPARRSHGLASARLHEQVNWAREPATETLSGSPRIPGPTHN